MFSIKPDRPHRIIRIESSGLGTVKEVRTFFEELEAVVTALGWRTGEYVTLLHTVDQVVQPQAVAQTIAELMRSFPIPARKVAIVKGGALAGLQTRRIIDERSSMFETADEAEKWLSMPLG